ncbi:MAG: ATP-dependent Clp protease ATP-binding subunit ClpC [Gaiellaceae bacterium]|nr:ATP-dependent Clp protease ATP-binding subunit ClpC [Gaiellaceae bacterium]
MFDRFTPPARQVIVLAQDEARELKQDYIGTEHLLLSLLREGEGLAARTLREAGVSNADLRARIVSAGGEGKDAGQIPFTKHARHVLENGLRIAVRWNHGMVGTEHLLAGLLADPSSRAVRLLADTGLQPAAIAERLFATMGFTDPAGEGSGYAPAAAESDEVRPLTDGPYIVGDG